MRRGLIKVRRFSRLLEHFRLTGPTRANTSIPPYIESLRTVAPTSTLSFHAGPTL